MFKALTIFILFINTLINPKINLASKYNPDSYIVMDGYSKEILEGKNYHKQRSVASISKIMTAIIALESEKLFYAYTIPLEVTNIEGSSIYLKENEQYRLIDLVYGLLLRSGNDASYAIAYFVSKDVKLFVKKMNEKALELGMKNTIFSNPCGLDIYDKGNISTSFDMALLMKYCLNNELFKEIIHTKKYSFSNHVYFNKNKLLHSYEPLIGGKTGFTSKARRTLVTSAIIDSQLLIIVTLDCSNDFNFHRELYEAYFDKYQYIVFLFKGLNVIEEYVFKVDELIGLRLEKELVNNGKKRYYINLSSLELTICFIDNQGQEHYSNLAKNIKCFAF